MVQRPENFILKRDHSLAKGLVFAGLGGGAGTLLFVDASSYGRHGTLTNMNPTSDVVWSTELGRLVYDFDGSNDHIRATHPAGDVVPPMTLSCWLKTYRTSGSTVGYIMAKRDGATYTSTQYAWFLSDPGYSGTPNALAWWDSSDVPQIFSTGTITEGQPNHCAVTLSAAGGLTFYINGVPAGTGSRSLVSRDGIDLFMGARGNGGGTIALPFYGWQGDWLVYNRALSFYEIKKLADSSNVMLSGMIEPPKRKYYPIKYITTTSSTYKFLTFKQNNQFLVFKQ